MRTIFFVDDGQDFTQWDIDAEGKVVACRPFQGWVWIGPKVHNKDIKPGDHLDITTRDGIHRTLIHRVDRVQELVQGGL